METIPLRAAHLEEAATLFARAYKEQRALTPDLPPRHERPEHLLPRLKWLLDHHPGVAALEGGRLVGYLSGIALEEFKGEHPGVYCPEWAHAACGEDRRGVYQRMYNHLSRSWVADGRYNQAVTVLAGDAEARDLWFWNGFGLLVVDAVRPLDKIEKVALPAGLVIKAAGRDDLDAILDLSEQHQRHYADPPLYIPLFDLDDRGYYEDWLAQEDHVFWLADQGGEAVSYLCLEPANPKACYIITDPKTASITGAFTIPAARGRGIATTLLATAIEWARAKGYTRLAVDFESANVPGRAFWLRHFRPVCFSLLRHIDERIAKAANGR